MTEKTTLDYMVEWYVEGKFPAQSGQVNPEEIKKIQDAIKEEVVKDACRLAEKSRLEDGIKRAEEQVEQYRRRIFRKLKITLIVETMFVAFLIGMIVNQTTNFIPSDQWVIRVVVILTAMLLCVLIVVLQLSEPD